MLNDDDKLATPLPLPYDGKIYSIGELNDFVSGSIASGKQPIIIFGANSVSYTHLTLPTTPYV